MQAGGGINGFRLPHAFVYLNACARSAPLANPLRAPA